MDIKQTTEAYRLSQWAETMKAFRASGKTIRAFCEEAGIRRHAFFYWQRKLRGLACTELARMDAQGIVPSGWLQLPSQGTMTTAASQLTVEVSGCRIAVNSETNPELLLAVCRTLRSL